MAENSTQPCFEKCILTTVEKLEIDVKIFTKRYCSNSQRQRTVVNFALCRRLCSLQDSANSVESRQKILRKHAVLAPFCTTKSIQAKLSLGKTNNSFLEKCVNKRHPFNKKIDAAQRVVEWWVDSYFVSLIAFKLKITYKW